MKRLYRSENDVKFAGICGGIGEEWEVDSGIIRLAVVFLTVVTAIMPMLVTYLVGWMILPKGRPNKEVA